MYSYLDIYIYIRRERYFIHSYKNIYIYIYIYMYLLYYIIYLLWVTQFNLSFGYVHSGPDGTSFSCSTVTLKRSEPSGVTHYSQTDPLNLVLCNLNAISRQLRNQGMSRTNSAPRWHYVFGLSSGEILRTHQLGFWWQD